MNTENEMNEEVRQLLDSLEEHGCNAKRQQRLGDLIDSLEASGTSLQGGTTKQSRPKVELLVWTASFFAVTRSDC